MDAVLMSQGGAVVAALVVLWVLLDWEAHRERARRVGRRLGLVPLVDPVPPGPPIERIAADVRRIRTAIRQAPAGMPVARRRGWSAAYDDVLVSACRALDLEQGLETAPPGSRHDFERERVERMLVRTGLLTPQDVQR